MAFYSKVVLVAMPSTSCPETLLSPVTGFVGSMPVFAN